MNKIKKNGLITVFDENTGEKINYFGEYLNIVKNQNFRANKPILKIYNSKLYVLNMYYPILKVFTLKGKLLNTYTLREDYYKSLVPQNYDPKTFKNSSVTNTKYLFKAMSINEKGIFIGLYQSNLIIDQFNFKGEFLKRYKYSNVNNYYYLYDFVIKNSKNEITFYVLNREKVPKVTVYRLKRN